MQLNSTRAGSGQDGRDRGRRRRGWWAAAGALVVTAVAAGCSGPPEPQPEVSQPEVSQPEVAQPEAGRAPTGAHRPPATSFVATSDREIAGCRLFERDHFLNARNIDALPVHPDSDTFIGFLGGTDEQLKTPRSSIWEGSRPGMPINVVDSRETGMTDLELNHSYTGRSHFGPYPLPTSPRIEGYPGRAWDKHLVTVDVADCSVYELIQFNPDVRGLSGRRTALAGTRYSLAGTEMPEMTTNVANTPLVGQYVMVDEVNAGRVEHPIGACTRNGRGESTWPARNSDGPHDTPDAPPMGSWMRLRGDVDLERFTGQARPVADALRNHGLILTDTCPHPLSIMGENSDGWVDDDMAQLGELTMADFEFVDVTPMIVSEDSFAIR